MVFGFWRSRRRRTKEKLAWLRAAVEEGEASGDAGPLDIEALKDEARRLYGFPPRTAT
jgi:Arc/MetJ-type ribon-helix-helix transcriptional regulator